MMKKNVVFVNSIPPKLFGGGENWMFRTAKALHDKSYAISLVARPKSRIIEKFSELNAEVFPLNFGCDFNPVSIFKLYKYFRKLNNVYLILNFNKDVSIAGIAGRLAGAKKIIFRNGFPLIHHKLKHKMLLPFFDTLLSNSWALVDRYKSYGWGIENKITVIHNGIEVDENCDRRYEKAAGEPFVILGAGRLTKIKRFDVFIDIIARLKQAYPIYAIIAGDGPELENLKLLSDSLEADVEFVGHVPSIQHLLEKADVFLHTSRNEGVPNVVMEAMSYGVPAVATNAGGTKELVKDSVTGFLCEINDIDGLIHKLELLLRDTKLRENLGREAWRTIKSNFNFHQSIDQIEALFE